MNEDGIWKKTAAEAVGTFTLVFVGCGAIMVNQLSGGTITHLGIALSFGLAVMVMIYAVGHISGAHFNPAVTLAFASIRRFPWREVPLYVAGQTAGATAASFSLLHILGPIGNLGTTIPVAAPGQALLLEFILTFFLMFVIVSVATDARAVGQMAGLAIGGTVALDAIFGGPISGASMNPARSFGPALVGGEFDSFWVYLAGPIPGAAMAAWLYERIKCAGDGSNANGCC